MNELQPQIIVKEMFFDRKKVMDAISPAKRRALSKIGAFVRTRMRSVTGRRSKKSAATGRPPNRHAGQLHDKISFGYDANLASVVIGPEVFKKGEAPKLLEFKGAATRTNLQGKRYTAHYRGNPFAGPSLKAEIDAGTIAPAWANSVKS